MEQIIIPVATAALGFIVANWKDILGWRNKTTRDELALYDELQKAVRSAREDILQLYKIIDDMESQNHQLKTEKMALITERDMFKALADSARKKLDETLAYVDQLENKLKLNFNPNKGDGKILPN
jgi:hypothetical protein